MAKALPLYDTTLTLFKVSTLYDGRMPILKELNFHSRRLGEQLRGSGLRDLIDEGGVSRSFGVLQNCRWSLIGDEAYWLRIRDDDEGEDDLSISDDVSPDDAKGVLIELQYEKTSYRAVLLNQTKMLLRTKGFTDLPLLLVKMPAALRDLLMRYIRTAFDCRISPLTLRSTIMGNILERSLAALSVDPGSKESDLNTGCQIQLAFPAVSPNLRSLEIAMGKEDVLKFLQIGRLLHAENDRDNAVSQSTVAREFPKGSFSTALSAYLEEQTSLRLDHQGVVLAKFACGPIALSGEGKVKVARFIPSLADLWELLVAEATSKPGLTQLQQVNETQRRTEKVRRQFSEPQHKERFPTEPPPPYELHDPAHR